MSGGEDGAVQRWCDLQTSGPVFSLNNFDAPLTSLDLSATTTLALTYANDISFHLIVQNSSPSQTFALPHLPSSASLYPTSRDRFVAGPVGDPWVRVDGLEDGEKRGWYKGHRCPVHCVMYRPDGERYASGSRLRCRHPLCVVHRVVPCRTIQFYLDI